MIYSTSVEDQPNLGIMHLVIYRVATAEVTFISVLPSTDECCWQVQRQTDTDRQMWHTRSSAMTWSHEKASKRHVHFICEESITAGAQLKETHHPNTYTHPGMHIQKSPVSIPKESWKYESGTNLLLQRGVITIGIIWSLPNHYHPINDSQPLSHTELSQNLTGLVLFPTSALGLHPDSSLSNYRL